MGSSFLWLFFLVLNKEPGTHRALSKYLLNKPAKLRRWGVLSSFRVGAEVNSINIRRNLYLPPLFFKIWFTLRNNDFYLSIFPQMFQDAINWSFVIYVCLQSSFTRCFYFMYLDLQVWDHIILNACALSPENADHNQAWRTLRRKIWICLTSSGGCPFLWVTNLKLVNWHLVVFFKVYSIGTYFCGML